jgi:hypothetical protein
VVGVVWDGYVGGGEHEFLCFQLALYIEEAVRVVLTPLLGFTLPLSTASMMLPFSSATSRTQSVLPVATIRCVLHPLTWPYSSSVSSISNLRGYLILQLEQSCRQSSPSTAGSVVGNRCSVRVALENSPLFLSVGTSDDDSAEVSLYDRFLNMAGTLYAFRGLGGVILYAQL